MNDQSLEAAEEIKSADLKLAHSQRFPSILKGKGVAKVTRYGKVEYYVVSPAMIKKLVNSGSSSADTLNKLKARYKKAQLAMQSTAQSSLNERSLLP